jgi:hypothetical protein
MKIEIDDKLPDGYEATKVRLSGGTVFKDAEGCEEMLAFVQVRKPTPVYPRFFQSVTASGLVIRFDDATHAAWVGKDSRGVSALRVAVIEANHDYREITAAEAEPFLYRKPECVCPRCVCPKCGAKI